MNKSFRQGQILRVIRSKEIRTQEELARELDHLGIQATQVTLSRDIRDLGLVKTADGYRQLVAERAGPELARAIKDYLLDVRIAQNLIVLRTSPGNASPLAVCIDQQHLQEVVGTIAGDDTVLVIATERESADRFREKILELMSA